MKRNVLKIIALVTVLTFTNCASDDRNNVDIASTENTANLNTLKINLQNFNKNFKYTISTNNNMINGKKWWQYVGQAAAIASGDAMGAAGGAWAAQGLAGIVGAATAGTGYAIVSGIAIVVGGVGGSYMAYCSSGGHCRGTFDNVSPRGSSVVYDFPTKFDYLENTGVLHNNGLQNIYLSNETISEYDWTNQNISNINQIDYDTLYNSPEFQNFKNDINIISSNYRESNYDIKILLDGYKDKNLINDNVYQILNLYFTATLGAQTFEDYKAITDEYVLEVTNSYLTDKEKESLLSAFAVSVQSYYYWINLEV